MERFETQGVKLCEEAVRALGENEDVQSATHLLLVSCTGFVAPGIDQMLIDSLGLDPGLERTAIGFMGCSAAIRSEAHTSELPSLMRIAYAAFSLKKKTNK